MDVLQQKQLLVERIIPHLIGAPDDVVQRLLQKTSSISNRSWKTPSRKRRERRRLNV